MKKQLLLILFFAASLSLLLISPPSKLMLRSNSSSQAADNQVTIRFKTPPAHRCFVFFQDKELSRARTQEQLKSDSCYIAQNGVIYLLVNKKRAIYLIPENKSSGFDALISYQLTLNGLDAGSFKRFELSSAPEHLVYLPGKIFAINSLGRSIEAPKIYQQRPHFSEDTLIWSPGTSALHLPEAFFEALESFTETELKMKSFPR